MTAFAFILGCPRSGTTFLARSLQPTTRADVVVGFLFPPQLAHLAATTRDPETKKLVDRSLAGSLIEYAASLPRYRAAAVVSLTQGNLSAIEAIEAFRRHGRSIETLIYKEPFLAFAPDLALRALPGSRVIHIYRDGRDCADSLVRTYGALTDTSLRSLNTQEVPLGRRVGDRYVPWWVDPDEDERFLGATPYVRAVWMWREMVRRCLAVMAHPQNMGHVLHVRYEDFMSDPVRVGETVHGFLGHNLGRLGRSRLRKAHIHSIGIHRKRDPDEIALATDLAYDELRRLGYVTSQHPRQIPTHEAQVSPTTM